MSLCSLVYRLLPGLLLALSAANAGAQPFSSDKPLALVVAFAPGGPTDNVGRALAQALHTPLQQTVVVENRPGAGGTLGTAYVSRARPDGHTALLAHVGFAAATALYRDPGFDPASSFAPVGMVVDVPMVLIARKDFPARNIQEFIAYVRQHADRIAIGHAGVGSASHLCSVMLAAALDAPGMLSVPYRGTAPAITDLLGGQIDVICDQTTNALPYVQAGSVQSYAVTSLQRIPQLPELPTLDETGLQGFEMGVWHGLMLPAGTPDDVVEHMAQALRTALEDPTFRQRMAALGAVIPAYAGQPQALQKKIAQQIPHWRQLLQAAGVQAQ